MKKQDEIRDARLNLHNIICMRGIYFLKNKRQGLINFLYFKSNDKFNEK